MQSSLFLVHSFGGVTLSKFSLGKGQTCIGRSPQCAVCLPDGSVSRRHAEVCVADGCITVRDLESRNGTFVDERRVQSGPVLPGQVLRFGAVCLTLSAGDGIDAELGLESDTAISLAGGGLPGLKALATGIASEFGLSEAEGRVFELLLSGLLQKQVAAELCLSQHTVHNHCKQIYRLLKVRSRAELLIKVLSRLETRRTLVADPPTYSDE